MNFMFTLESHFCDIFVYITIPRSEEKPKLKYFQAQTFLQEKYSACMSFSTCLKIHGNNTS